MKLWQAFSVIVVCFSVVTAHADILFLDVNNSPKEIEAAQKAAIARKEKLIVLPDPKKQSAADRELRKQIEESTKSAQAICNTSAQEQCMNAIQARRKLIEKQRASSSYLSEENLSKELAAMKKNGTKLSSLVVSGHDGNGHFGGSQGALSDASIASAFADNAPVGDGIRSMMLWGCYTANIGSLSHHWKKALPNVELIAGYDGIAPLGDKPANWDYLTDVLTKEKKLTEIKDANELKKALQGLDGTNLLNASMCVGDNYASHKLALNLKDAKKLCAGTMDAVKTAYDCYLKAETDQCANPPKNTGNSELRTAYNKLQDSRHCIEDENGEVPPDSPSPDTLIRLIHFQNVKDNLVNDHPDLISHYNELAKQLNLPDEVQWGDISKMTRQQILSKLNKSKDLIEERLKVKTPDTPELWALAEAYNAIQNALGDLRVPFSWVEPSANDKVAYLSDATAGMSKKNVSSYRRQYESRRAEKDLEASISNVISDKNPEYKKIADKQSALEKEYTELGSQVTSGNPPNKDAILKKMDQMRDEYKSLTKSGETMKENGIRKYEAQIREEAKKMADQPYANSEGQKAYQTAMSAYVDGLYVEKARALSPEEIRAKASETPSGR